MASIRVIVTLVLVLTLGLALPVAAQPLSGPEFIDLTPCRILDTRTGAPLPGGMVRDVQITGVCNVPTNVVVTAAALNFTIVTPTAAGHLTVFPKNGVAPLTSLINYVAGETVANAVDIGLGTGGQISVQPLTTTHLVIDVYGYFTDVEELAGQNTALGAEALNSITTGLANTALGWRALLLNTTGDANTATGSQALTNNTTGFSNTAMGTIALIQNTTGINNIAIGFSAGSFVTTGRDNIHIGNTGAAADTALIRIGAVGAQTATFIAGIAPVTLAEGSPAVCVVATTGQLGRCPSPPSASSNQTTGTRRPVSLDMSDQELVTVSAQDEPPNVGYQVLLNEVQRQRREIDELRAQVRALIGGRAAVRE
jgi:hypothetical protein